jgi:hypothetical protein
MQRGQKDERTGQCECVRCDHGTGSRRTRPQGLEKIGERGFAKCAECKAAERNSELHARYDAMKIAHEGLYDFRAGIFLRDQLPDAGQAHSDKRKFGRCEKTVERDKHQYADQANDEHAEWGLLAALYQQRERNIATSRERGERFCVAPPECVL